MQLHSLNKKILSLWYLRTFLVWLILAAICIVPALLLKGNIQFLFYGIAILLTVLLFLYPPFKYRFYKFGHDDRKIVLQYGVIFRHDITIPICQIQDLHLFQGPLMRIFHLEGLILSTAGSNFSVAGLMKEDAVKLVDLFETLIEERAKDEEIC